MSLAKKLKTCQRILKEDGIKGFMTTLQAKLHCLTQPDEAHIIAKLLEAPQQPGLMIDVGAHHGASLKHFAKHNWQVIAFEPDPKNRKHLTRNGKAYKNLIIDDRACSNQVQNSATFFTSAESTGVSSLTPFLNSHTATHKVTVTTLAAAIDEYGITTKPVDFLKSDTEGFDLMVLQGFPWHTAPHPRVILCEFEDKKSVPLGYDFHELAEYLLNLDYHLVISEWHPVINYGGRHRWRCFSHYPSELADKKGWGNIIAVKDEQTFTQLQHLTNTEKPDSFS